MTEQQKAALIRIRDQIDVSRVTCSRTVRSRNGDSFVSFSAGWGETHDDVDAPTVKHSMAEARVASHLVARQADLAAFEHAFAGCHITGE